MRNFFVLAQEIISEILEHTYITENRPPFRFTHEEMSYLVQNMNEIFKEFTQNNKLKFGHFFLNDEIYMNNPHTSFSEMKNPRWFSCFIYDKNRTDYDTILVKEGYPAEYFEHWNSEDELGYLHRNIDHFQR